jgi:hypothetical protein
MKLTREYTEVFRGFSVLLALSFYGLCCEWSTVARCVYAGSPSSLHSHWKGFFVIVKGSSMRQLVQELGTLFICSVSVVCGGDQAEYELHGSAERLRCLLVLSINGPFYECSTLAGNVCVLVFEIVYS